MLQKLQFSEYLVNNIQSIHSLCYQYQNWVIKRYYQPEYSRNIIKTGLNMYFLRG